MPASDVAKAATQDLSQTDRKAAIDRALRLKGSARVIDETLADPAWRYVALAVVVLLTLASGIYLVILRIKAVRRRVMRLSYYRVYRNGEEPEGLAVATRHYINLFETPVLFYLGCLVAGVLGPVNTWNLAVTWLYTGLRILQSIIHLTSNRVIWRAYVFFASLFFLVTLWISNVLSLAAKV